MDSFNQEASTSLAASQELLRQITDPLAGTSYDSHARHHHLYFATGRVIQRSDGSSSFKQDYHNRLWKHRDQYLKECYGKPDRYWTYAALLNPVGRTTQDCAWAPPFYVDFDKNPAVHSYSLSQMKKIFWDTSFENHLPKPSFVLDSGEGFWAHWFCGPYQPDQFPAFQRMEREIQARFAHIGADPACTDVPRFSRVPGSINSKTGKMVSFVRYSDEICCEEDFQEFFEKEPVKVYSIGKLEQHKEEKDAASKPPSRTRKTVIHDYHQEEAQAAFNSFYDRVYYTVGASLLPGEEPVFEELWNLENTNHYDFLRRAAICTLRIPWLHALADQRKVEGSAKQRELHAFNYLNNLVVMGKPPEVCLDLLGEFVKKLSEDPAEQQEFYEKAQSCFKEKNRTYDGMVGNPAPGYLYRNSTLFRNLMVTKEEAQRLPSLNTWILLKSFVYRHRTMDQIVRLSDLKVFNFRKVYLQHPEYTYAQLAKALRTSIGNISGWKKRMLEDSAWKERMIQQGLLPNQEKEQQHKVQCNQSDEGRLFPRGERADLDQEDHSSRSFSSPSSFTNCKVDAKYSGLPSRSLHSFAEDRKKEEDPKEKGKGSEIALRDRGKEFPPARGSIPKVG